MGDSCDCAAGFALKYAHARRFTTMHIRQSAKAARALAITGFSGNTGHRSPQLRFTAKAQLYAQRLYLFTQQNRLT
ncbi:MAG: hypothetical protein ACQRW7_09185 [Caulobacterales bacterium]|uniref:hypothetical protein n=1 Tax=Glycocaulis sp. TaxID=1969725 RepID=UPI003FA02027